MASRYQHAMFGAALSVLIGCSESNGPSREQLRDALAWESGEQSYRTNAAPGAYRSLLNLKDELSRRQAAGRRYLRYTYCQAVVNGQLFVLAEHLGDTNAAASYFKESVGYWTEEAKEARLPEKEYSEPVVRDLILKYDAHTGPVFWRQQSKSQNETNSTEHAG